MDLFQAICAGLGLAIAGGLVIGAAVPPIMPSWGTLAGAIPLGILLAAAALNADDEPIPYALPVGVIGAGIAAYVSRSVTASAARREGRDGAAAGPPAALTAIVFAAAALIAVLALFVPYASLAVLAALIWLALTRRRKEAQKHEGLRILS